MTAPIIKWAGGKTRLLPELCKRMPPRYRMYYEPFLGGGAMFFHQLPPHAIISDNNPDLCQMYMAVQLDVDKVIASLAQMQHHWGTSKRQRLAYYEKQRDTWNGPLRTCGHRSLWKPHYRAAMFIFLNRTCFNGLWRVNKSGKFNVPMGRYGRDHVICDPSKLRAAARALAPVRIRFGDYWNNCQNASDGDFVYLDPPYDPISASSNFTAYTEEGFGRGQQLDLANRALTLVHMGAQVMLSNADTRFVRGIYRQFGFKLHKVSAPRAINSKASARGKVGELIITGGY